MRQGFRAMGTEVVVAGDDATTPGVFAEAVAIVTGIFEREEARFSRFRGDSELSTVNRSPGEWIDVSRPFADVVRMAIEGAERTEGLFDPTVLGALESAGYDRDFAAIDEPHRTVVPAPCGGWDRIEIGDGRVRIPGGVRLDLGGLVKGWTADLSAEAAVAAGLGWAIVNAGGDLRIAGDGPAHEVGIEDPEDRREVLCVMRIDGGAIASTSVTQRRWGPGLHHLIDPRIGLPAATPVAQATVWAPTCAEAEISSKLAALKGTEALDELSAVLVLASGEVVTNLDGAAA
jgi:thiamine biosynthesis lipoprotein